MASAKTHDFKGKVYTEVPSEAVKVLGIKPGDELEFKPIHENLVLLAPKKIEHRIEQKQDTGDLSAEELRVLKKINTIRHTDRTPIRVSKLLSKIDYKVFDSLIKKKIIFVFKDKKLKKELVGIAKQYFKYVIRERTIKQTKKDPIIKELEEKGFIVLENYNEARDIDALLKKYGMQNFVRGVRGFDRKYYVVTVDRLNELIPLFEQKLHRSKTLSELARDTRTSRELCRAALEIMKEDGEVIEKKKDTYVMA